jgi:hypothetical protein
MDGDPIPWCEWVEVTQGQLRGVPCVGCEHYDGIKSIRPGDPVTLKREPTNPVDPSAVAIFTDSGEQIGYVPKEMTGEVWREYSTGAKAWFCWEVLKGSERTGGRLALARKSLIPQVDHAMTLLRERERFT